MATSDNPVDSDFNAIVDTALRTWHIPGLSVSVADNEETWSKAYGLAHRFPEKQTEPTTLFYAASTTKAQLCAVWTIYIHSEANTSKPEDERIRWSTPLVDLIGDDFVLEDPIRTRHVTLEDAVSHRTGMPRHDLCYGKEQPNTAKAVTRHLRHLPLRTELRTEFEYCNTMYFAATHALETVAGKPLSQILREWLWEPLGMRQTYLGFKQAEKAMKERGEVLAKGYYWTKLPGSEDYDDGEFVEQPWMDFPEVSGAGEVISTADDYAKWMRCLLSSSSPLSEAMTKDLFTARSFITEEGDDSVPFDGGLLNYGLGWFICSYKGYRVLFHPGGIIGAGSMITLVPELKWGMSFFGNGADVSAKVRGLTFAVLDKILGVKGGAEGGMERVEKAALEQYRKIGDAFKEGKKSIYPNASEKPTIPLTLPIEDYAGTYRSKAYGRLKFSVQSGDGDEGANSEKRLYCLADNRTWTSSLTLSHVNAEFWLGKRALAVSPLHRAFRAESKIGVDGRVESLGLVMEGTMPERLIWFQREG